MKVLLTEAEHYFYDHDKDCFKCYEDDNNADTDRELVHNN